MEACVSEVGVKDVKECYEAIEYCIKNGLGHPDKIGLTGGSYGGYLGAALIATYPDQFKCNVQMNGVTEFTVNSKITDIPEWNHSEALASDLVVDESIEQIQKMLDVSPITMINGKNITTKVLMLIGGQDNRCVPQQSIIYYKKMKKMGFDIRMLYFPKEGHALANDYETILEEMVQTNLFFEENLG